MSDPTQGDRVNVTDVEMQDFPLPQDEVGAADVEATPSEAGPSTSSTPKKVISICGVCGDVARSLHFGGRCCDSCKAFFRRAVQNESSSSFKCYKGGVNEIKCDITMKTRKSCQCCRFKKCISIGMEEQWVLTTAERGVLAEQRRSRNEGELRFLSRHTILRAEDPQRNMDESEDVLSWEDKSEIISLLMKYHDVCIQLPYHEPTFPPDNQSGGKNSLDIIGLFVNIIRRIAVFYMNQPDFQNLPRQDKFLLMKSGALEICMLRSAIHYNFNTGYWSSMVLADNHKRSPHQTASTSSSSSSSSSSNSPFSSPAPPILQLDDMKKLVSLDAFQLQCKFMGDIQGLCADESTITILTYIVLFCPDRVCEGFPPLQASDQVALIQEKYLRLLKKYVNWRYGDTEGKRMYPKFLQKLADLRELTEKHLTSKINLEDAQSKMISDAMAAMMSEIR